MYVDKTVSVGGVCRLLLHSNTLVFLNSVFISDRHSVNCVVYISIFQGEIGISIKLFLANTLKIRWSLWIDVRRCNFICSHFTVSSAETEPFIKGV